jgi:hypothetical protein
VGTVTERPTDAEEPGGSADPWATGAGSDEPEPDWAAEIRARRKARGDRLRQIFSTFDEEKESDS